MHEAKPSVQNAHPDILSKRRSRHVYEGAVAVTDLTRTFDVASDRNLVDLISRARRRLVVICPALTEAVGEALAARLDEGFEGATIILDADPEVYRLGYGTVAGFDRVRTASDRNLNDLRIQPGVRIGVVISDDVTMIFSPVPRLIEAGSTSIEKPNAIVLSATSADRVAEAAGAGAAEAAERHEIGRSALTPVTADILKADLSNNPPQQFDVARALRVFTSKIQYVEIQVENYRLSSRQVPIPEDLLDITDEQLRDRISGRLRVPAEVLGPFEILVETKNGKAVVKGDEQWVTRERKRIEDKYTYVIPRYGRVIFHRDKVQFGEEIERFRRNVDEYCWAARRAFSDTKSGLESRLMAEYLPRWKRHPPPFFARHGAPTTEENLKPELQDRVGKMIDAALSFQNPVVRVVHKDVAMQSLHDQEFRAPLEKAMRRRGVPITEIKTLFGIGEVAPARASFSAA
jgi:hypothetical protein